MEKVILLHEQEKITDVGNTPIFILYKFSKVQVEGGLPNLWIEESIYKKEEWKNKQRWPVLECSNYWFLRILGLNPSHQKCGFGYVVWKILASPCKLYPKVAAHVCHVS